MKTVTLDTSVVDDLELRNSIKAAAYSEAVVTVTVRELKSPKFRQYIESTERLNEAAVWGESPWGSKWGGQVCGPERLSLKDIIRIITNGSSFDFTSMSEGQLHQLRDALIIQAHSLEKRDFFVTNDKRGFINNGRREKFGQKLGVQIFTADEFKALLSRTERRLN